MKITFIYDFLKELGGLERVMFFHANLLKQKHDVELLFSHISDKEAGGITTELELDKSISVSQIGTSKIELWNLLKAFLFPSRTNKVKTDLIISESFMCSRMAYKKKKADETPYIIVMHHPPNFLYSPPKGWANNPARLCAMILGNLAGPFIKKLDIDAVRNADLVIAGSQNAKKRIQGIYRVNPVIVYPSISNFFKPLGLKKKKFLYIHGRIIPDKNCKAVIPMMRSFEGYDLIISGSISDSYKKELEDEAIKYGVADRVKILGRIPKDELVNNYNTASLFLVPAVKEDFGLTTVEAIACGCPVIAWDDGAGSSEIVTKDNGLLAFPYDERNFINKIKQGLSKRWHKDKIVASVKRFSEEETKKEFMSAIKEYVK